MAKQESAADICRRRTLQTRIRAMAKRWEYAKDEYEEALERAKKDPVSWEALCDQDEARFGVASEEVSTNLKQKHEGPPIPYDRIEPEPGKSWWSRDGEPTST
jgi:hypothetical protein